jgi:hypothetical protein
MRTKITKIVSVNILMNIELTRSMVKHLFIRTKNSSAVGRALLLLHWTEAATSSSIRLVTRKRNHDKCDGFLK